MLAERSLTVSRPILLHYLQRPALARALVDRTLAALASGIIAPLPATTLPLAQAAEAHRMIEARESPGAVILVP